MKLECLYGLTEEQMNKVYEHYKDYFLKSELSKIWRTKYDKEIFEELNGEEEKLAIKLFEDKYLNSIASQCYNLINEGYCSYASAIYQSFSMFRVDVFNNELKYMLLKNLN